MKSIKYLSLIICLGYCLSSCTKKLDEAYANPNAPLGIRPVDLLQPICYQMGVNQQDDYRYIGLYAQVYSYRLTYAAGSTDAFTYFDKMGYRAGVDNSGAIWRMHYFNIGQNLNTMRKSAVANKQWDYVGAADAIQAWSWLTLTDYHGEVILKDAFDTSLLSFRYDTQEDVYAHVRNLCRSALLNFDNTVSGGDFATGDVWFNGGDINKWRRFIYGTMARSFNHLTNKTIYQPDSVIFYCDKAMQVPGDDATIKFQGNTSFNNTNSFYGSFRGNLGSFRQSKYIAELMKGTYAPFTGVDDPRKWYMLMTAPDYTTFNGYSPVVGEGTTAAAVRPRNFWGAVGTTIPGVDSGRFMFRNNAEYPIMTSSEIQFMKAEAAFRKNDKTTARAAYLNGISQHMDMLTTKYELNIYPGKSLNTAGVKAAFLANPVVAPSAANLTLSHIMQQKFIALWGYSVLETWTDLRRYHYNSGIDPMTTLPVYNGWTPVSNTDLWIDNGNDKLAYRVRPRYNSEYIWNIAELIRIGGNLANYHTKEMWFSLP